MEEDIKLELDSTSVAAQNRYEKLHYQRMLRELELKAYSGVLEALRASGKPNSEKDGIIKSLRDYFSISEERHKAELRVLAYDDKLSRISQKLSGHNFITEWSSQAQPKYIPLVAKDFSLYRRPISSCTTSTTVIGGPVPSGRFKDHFTFEEDSDDSDSDSELEVLESILKKHPSNGWQPEKHKPITVAVEAGTGNEQEIEELELQLKKKINKNQAKKQSPAKSPDITDAPNTPTKQAPNLQRESKGGNIVRPRGVKRKKSEDNNATSHSENPITLTNKKTAKRIVKIKKTNNPPPVAKILRRPESKRAKESSEETSSADEGENGPLPLLEESSRVMSPVFSEVIRSSVLGRGRGGFRGRGGVDRRRSNLASPSKNKSGKLRSRTSNQKSSKFKNTGITSTGSRRKSKLNEKIDYDEVLMDVDGNNLEKQRFKEDKRELEEREQKNDNRTFTKEFKSTDECAVYTESLPISYNHEELEQVTDGVFKRPLPPSRGPKPWEIHDARLSSGSVESINDENNSKTNNYVNYGEIGVGPPSTEAASHISSNANDTRSPSSNPKVGEQTPPHKKQRIKSPIIVNPNINPPNVSKVPLPAPVFSTSLNTASKKRHKPISVVDSLNLHLPTSATASSLAASSNNRRPGTNTGGGCSMFSNSSALIAGARGTAPGILQQQRKAQPHILVNSKVHQRTFLPAMNSNSISNNVSNNIVPISGTPVTLACAPSTISTISANPVAAAQTVQITNSPVPISGISPGTPTSIPFQSFPNPSSPGISLGTAAVPVPIGHVNRSAASTNIIFVQKANGPAVSGGTAVSSNVIPLKTPPRAVILRRTQMPRQGNVMILDMQKNQLVSPTQVPPFLQTARILNAPGELSLLNIQSSTSPRKNTPSPVLTSPTSTIVPSVQSLQPTSEIILTTSPVEGRDNETVQVTCREALHNNSHNATQTPILIQSVSDSSTSNHQEHVVEKVMPSITAVVQHPRSSQDAQYAQIEAELMQMEQGNFEEVVYEEEVTTEIVPMMENENQQYIFTNDTCSSSDGQVIVTSHNASSGSGSSTDTASENEISINTFESPEADGSRHPLVTTVSLSPMGEAKIATEAITRALSLSKSSPAKKLTFSVPVSSGIPTFSIVKSSAASTIVKDSPTQVQATTLPIIFQATTASLKTPNIVLERDPSTNIHIGKSQGAFGVEIAVTSNDIQELPPSHLQTNVNNG